MIRFTIDRFTAAKLKVERADKHISDLDKIIDSLPDLDVSTVDRDRDFGHQILKHALPNAEKIAIDMAVIIGDAVHNLRVAIEYAYLGAFERHGLSVDKKVTFPIRETRRELEAALGGRNIQTRAPRLFHVMVSHIKSYNVGGNDLFAMLHKLDLSDKHHLLIPLTNYVGVNGIVVEDETGQEVSGNSLGIQGFGPYFFIFSAKCNIQNKGKLTVKVVFSNQSILDGSPVSGILKNFSTLTLNTIKALESS
jgi:hypothetical protein